MSLKLFQENFNKPWLVGRCSSLLIDTGLICNSLTCNTNAIIGGNTTMVGNENVLGNVAITGTLTVGGDPIVPTNATYESRTVTIRDEDGTTVGSNIAEIYSWEIPGIVGFYNLFYMALSDLTTVKVGNTYLTFEFATPPTHEPNSPISMFAVVSTVALPTVFIPCYVVLSSVSFRGNATFSTGGSYNLNGMSCSYISAA